MREVPPWLAAEVIRTKRLTLEPLREEHAAEMAPLLDDDRLHRFIGGSPAPLEELRSRYRRQAAGQSQGGEQGWLNWVVRHRASGAAVGTVQATLSRDGDRLSAELAWVIATAHQRRGYATEAASGMTSWLLRQGVRVLVAHVHPANRASGKVAAHLGLAPTATVVDGETRWTVEGLDDPGRPSIPDS